MSEPSWSSQPFPPEGASAAEGIRNQLGRPELDLLTILVRESAQNSWDARLDGADGPVEYRIDLRNVGPAHMPVWRDLLQRGAPLDEHLPLRASLRQATVRIMTISDRGTSGLGGPTRADDAVTADRDFVQFVRNTGEPRDTELGGGTYGFGKGIFYLVSKPGAILIHTRCRTTDGELETRLIGCALWKSYVAPTAEGWRRYTGRHWWGRVANDVVEPLIGAEADAMSRRLGLSPFDEQETGTSIVVIDPSLDEREPIDAARYLAETISWHLWPKMISGPTGAPAMRFSVSCDGVEVPVPNPLETRPLDLFVDAYLAMKGQDSRSLDCGRPKKHLGRLGLKKKIMPALEPSDASKLVGIEKTVHHVCLMRPAELVVTYHPGPPPPDEFLGYAGVFRADDSLDDTYARAEPPTHDAWNPQSLESPENTFVRTTFVRINEALSGLLELGGGTRGGAAQVALGAASNMFSPLMAGSWGTGGATDYSGSGTASGGRGSGGGGSSGGSGGIGDRGSGGSRHSRPRVDYTSDPYIDERAGAAVIVQPFRLPVSGLQRVEADVAVAISSVGGRETDPPVDAAMPGLVCWEDPSGRLFNDPSHLIEGGSDAVWKAIIRPAPDTMTDISITTELVHSS